MKTWEEESRRKNDETDREYRARLRQLRRVIRGVCNREAAIAVSRAYGKTPAEHKRILFDAYPVPTREGYEYNAWREAVQKQGNALLSVVAAMARNLTPWRLAEMEDLS